MDHYEVLQVSRGASQEVIRAAYRALVQREHPDRAGDDSAHQERLKQINRAYDVLSNPHRRAAYDASLPGTGAPMVVPAAPLAPFPTEPVVADAGFSLTWQPGVVLDSQAQRDPLAGGYGRGHFGRTG